MQTVVLYGNSLVISSLAASLENQPHLNVHQIKGKSADLDRVKSLNPDVLIFDLVTAQSDYDTITLISKHPQLLLVGIDPDSHQMLVWSGRQVRALTVQDLVQEISAAPVPSGHLDGLRHLLSGQVFAAGAVLGGVLIGLWRRLNKRHPSS